MRIGLALIALMALPQQASAFTAMQVNDCNAAWQIIEKGTSAEGSHSVTKDGWCKVPTPAGSKASLEWRAEGLERFLQHSLAPTALAIRVEGADLADMLELETKPDAPAIPVKIMLVLRENAQDKQVVIEKLEITGPKDNRVLLQGILHDVDLSSVAKTQFSMGSAKLRDVVLVALGNRQLEPYLRPYIGATFPERTRRRSAMIDKVTEWPDHSFPPETKQAVKQLIATLPAPNGTLRVEVDMGAGLSAGILMRPVLYGEALDDMIKSTLEGMIFHATWTAAE